MVQSHLLTVSDVWSVGEPQINPNADEAQRIAARYCEKLGIVLPHFQKYTTMPSYLFPRASVERLVAAGIFFNLLWFIDNHQHVAGASDSEQMRRVFTNCYRLLRFGIQPTDNHLLYPICAELHFQFTRLAPKPWIDRLGKAFMSHLNSTSDDLADMVRDGDDPVERYIALCVHDTGKHSSVTMTELANNIYLTDALLEDAHVQKMFNTVLVFDSLANDLFSYEKSVMSHGSEFNLIAVMMKHRQYTSEEAVHDCVWQLNQLMDVFQEGYNAMPTYRDNRTNRIARAYVEGLKDALVASWFWQLNTNRYHSSTSLSAAFVTLPDRDGAVATQLHV